MKHAILLKTLESLGLSETEASVYLAALSLGPSSILSLSRTSGIKRTTVYSVVGALRQKGLMTREIRGWKTLFAPERPERLTGIVEEKKANLAKALPDLSSLYNLRGGDGAIRFYDGLQAVKSVYESLLEDIRSHEDYLIVSDLKQWLSLDAEFFQDFTERRAKLPINIRMLAQPSDAARTHKKHERAYNETIRFLPEGTELTTNLVIIPRRVVIHQLVSPIFAMVVENPNMVRLHREQFEIIWKSLG